jgi:hypothetical protein
MSSYGHSKDGAWGSWALIVFLFAIGAWPVALPLLFIKLFAPDRDNRKSAESQIPYARSGSTSSASGQTFGTETVRQPENRAQTAAKKAMHSPTEKTSNSWILKIVGLILILIGATSVGDASGVWEIMTNLALAAGGAGMMFSSFLMDGAMRRYPRYLAVMGDEESYSFDDLARKLGYSRKKVIRDLQKMIDRGYFGGRAYLNMELGYFFRSVQADADFEQKKKTAEAKPPKEADEGYSGILRNIRHLNDEIADPVLSAKIDRLEEITAKIFQAAEQDPGKQAKMDTFMNYYLPTTQKLLDSYAKFEAAGVESDNVKASKERINQTMDSIIAGFEHQLAELYAPDTMDVDSDIRVMETMLNRDTASVEKDFGLGADTAAPAAPSVPKTSEVDLGGMAAQAHEE